MPHRLPKIIHQDLEFTFAGDQFVAFIVVMLLTLQKFEKMSKDGSLDYNTKLRAELLTDQQQENIFMGDAEASEFAPI